MQYVQEFIVLVCTPPIGISTELFQQFNEHFNKLTPSVVQPIYQTDISMETIDVEVPAQLFIHVS